MTHSVKAAILVLLLVGAAPVAIQASSTKEKILIFSKSQATFEAVSSELQKELSNTYDVAIVTMTDKTDQAAFEMSISKMAPRAVVLMDNQGVSLAKTHFEHNKSDKMAAFAIMGLNLKTLLKGDRHICGIAYEVSPYVLLTRFRSLVESPKISNVLTFYRGSQFSDFVRDAQSILAPEKIDLHAINLDGQSDILQYLKTTGLKEINSGHYDAVYVMLDSVILEKKIFNEFWSPTAKAATIPFLIGAEKLVEPDLGFAAFGIAPNPSDLASQTAQSIEGRLGGQSCEGAEDVVGVDAFLNTKRAQELKLKLKDTELSNLKQLK